MFLPMYKLINGLLHRFSFDFSCGFARNVALRLLHHAEKVKRGQRTIIKRSCLNQINCHKKINIVQVLFLAVSLESVLPFEPESDAHDNATRFGRGLSPNHRQKGAEREKISSTKFVAQEKEPCKMATVVRWQWQWSPSTTKNNPKMTQSSY